MNKKGNVSNRFLWIAALCLGLLPLSTNAAPGDLYVTNNSGSIDDPGIFKFTPDGTRSDFGPTLGPFGVPIFDLAFDRAGNLFGMGSPAGYDGVIFKYAPDGTYTEFGVPNSGGYTGLAFDGSGNLFAGEPETSLILKFTPAGVRSAFTSIPGRPSGQAFDRFGNLFVCDVARGAILKITPATVKTTFAFGLHLPVCLAFDSAGNLFVAEYSSGNIFKFNSAGVRSTFASGLGTIPGLAIDGADNLFVSDGANLKIFKFTPSGSKTVFASGGFDFKPGALAFEPVTEKLRNVSARGFVQTGENVLIGGFILGGNALANNAVVVRAIGPSLASSGVAHPLSNPKLELHNSSGAIVASNDDWQDTQAAQISAAGLAPTDPRESAIYATLPSGGFTAIVRGVSDTSGVALVEIYNLTN